VNHPPRRHRPAHTVKMDAMSSTNTTRTAIAALTLALTACSSGSDSDASYQFNGQQIPIDCDDVDRYVRQYAHSFIDSETVFNAWLDECGEDWMTGPAFDAILEDETP
jgi:hypothetical protein